MLDARSPHRFFVICAYHHRFPLTLRRFSDAVDSLELVGSLVKDLNAGIVAFAALRLREETPEVQLSNTSETRLTTALARLSIPSGGRLVVPDLLSYAPRTGLTKPFQWRTGLTERTAAPMLLSDLRTWVTDGMVPPIQNLFADVQSFTPVEFTVEGAGHFSGVPDMMVAKDGVGREDELQPLVQNAVLTVDWKTAAAFKKNGQIKAIGSSQAIAYSSYNSFSHGQPAFMTDMATGFRCWMVVDGKLYYLHPDNGDFTLDEGVALIRWFLVHGDTYTLCVDGRKASWVSTSGSAPDPAARPRGTSGRHPEAPASSGLALDVGSKGVGRSERSSGLISRDVSPDGTSPMDDDLATVICEVRASILRGGMRCIDL